MVGITYRAKPPIEATKRPKNRIEISKNQEHTKPVAHPITDAFFQRVNAESVRK